MKQIEGTMAMMEEQKMMLDNAIQMKDVMGAIKAGSQAVKEASKGVTAEDLENMKEEMDDLKQGQEELNDFFKDYADQEQDGVDEELEQLQQEMAKDEKDQDIEYLNRLRNERSLIVKKATNKLERLSELPGEGFNFVNSVVYCGQGKDNDTPIINSVTKILNEAHLSVHTFTSNTEN